MRADVWSFQAEILQGIPAEIPEPPADEAGVDHAPPSRPELSRAERELALANALRYFPPGWHPRLAPELARELAALGHIYMLRFRPHYPMHARAIHQPVRSPDGRGRSTRSHSSFRCGVGCWRGP